MWIWIIAVFAFLAGFFVASLFACSKAADMGMEESLTKESASAAVFSTGARRPDNGQTGRSRVWYTPHAGPHVTPMVPK